jgi:hypothetical protein
MGKLYIRPNVADSEIGVQVTIVDMEAFLCFFRKFQKASSWLSTRLSVRMEQLGPHWTNIYEIWYLRMIRKSVKKIQLWLKYGKNNGYFTW